MDRNVYQNELDRVRYTAEGRETLVDALMEAQAAGGERPAESRRRFHWTRGAAAAVLAAVVLLGTATAAVGLPRSLTDWFARQWADETGAEMNEDQAALIDRLTQAVGVSEARGDVTVTLDSLTRGNSGVWLLLDIQGADRDDRLHFDQMDLTFQPDPDTVKTPGGYGISPKFAGIGEDGVYRILLHYNASLIGEDSLLKGYEGTLLLRDLYLGGDLTRDEVLIQEGTWELRFTLEPAESEVLDLGSWRVPARDMETREPAETEIRNLQVSATDIRYTQSREDQTLEPDQVRLVLTDGTEIPWDGGYGRWTSEDDDGEWASGYYWRQPVDLSQAAALRFGGTEIPLR